MSEYKLNYNKLYSLGKDDNMNPDLFEIIIDSVECYLGMNNGCGMCIELPGSLSPMQVPTENMITFMLDCGVLEKVK